MGNEKQVLCVLYRAIKYTFIVIGLLAVLYIGMTFLWIALSPYSFAEFHLVLRLCIKHAGSYSVLLVGIVVTIFFQVYIKEKEIEKEESIKIREVGDYTLAFKLKEDNYEEEYNGDKIVVEISSKEDFHFDPLNNKEDQFHFFTKFLTSKRESVNLKNIMAFEEVYFETNKEDILKNYYQFCEKISYSAPLYCSSKPTNELECDSSSDKNRYFWLILKLPLGINELIKSFWISAVTEEEILLFIKVKVKLMRKGKKTSLLLLQQTTYYKCQNKLRVLFR